MKVYLAAPYQMKEIINARAAELRALGITVTSRWLEETHRPNTQLQEVQLSERRYFALQDVADIDKAEVFVLQPDSTETIKRQGRTVEMGIAIGISLRRSFPIFVVGDGEENIFHTLPQVYHFPDWTTTKAKLATLVRIEEMDETSPF